MKTKRLGFAILGTTALCAAAVTPVRLGDGRLHFWSYLSRNARLVLGHTFDGVGDFLRAAAVETRLATSQGSNTQGKPGQPTISQDLDDLKRAYTVALADQRIRALGYDPAGIENAIAAYRADDLVGGDAIAGRIADPLVRTALEWVALREVPQKIGLDRLNAFAATHPNWPAPHWLRHQTEARLLRINDPQAVLRALGDVAPQTAPGKFALARALKATGRSAEAGVLARSIFRESDPSSFLEGRIKAEFGSELTKGDFKYRADRLMYKEQIGPSLRYAALAGPDVVALEKARAAVVQDAPSDKAIAAVPEALRKDPGLLLAEVQKLRRADRLAEAAKLMQSAPRDRAQLIDGDEWWTERRMLARKLLDSGSVNAAYVICATHGAAGDEATIDAEFHAGWIALRYMNDPRRAAYHFAQAAAIAGTPTSAARIAYWQARTAMALPGPAAYDAASAYFRKAAAFGSTYYGQLSRNALGTSDELVREPSREALGPERDGAVRTIELLYAAGESQAAYALAVDAASNLKDEAQVAALATVIEAQGDAHLSLTIGKMIGQRGIAVDSLAFPTSGIPPFLPLQNSAALPVVYAIARQESTFMPSVVSKAGAKGLMQMIDATAKRTATKAGVPFDPARMLTDAAFNAQLGAAHLGTLLAEQNGSYILTFAAYNAGGGRVKQWIDAYGDPRKPGVDPVDWVERIPFTETRNYVQRVLANVTMYEAIFANRGKPARSGAADHEAKL